MLSGTTRKAVVPNKKTLDIGGDLRMTQITEFNEWLKNPEGCNLEFKKAANSFSKDKDLPDYCAALANEGGGKLILGVEDKTHQILGTKAFEGTCNKLSHELLNKIKIRVEVEELFCPNRVLIFHIPSHLPGQLIKSTGDYRYPMRAGESLIEMDVATLRRILNETEPDFSAKMVPGLAVNDMDAVAIADFRRRWAQKQGRPEYLNFSDEKLLHSVGILSDDGINYAGLILFAKKVKIDSLLPGSEIIFEWRSALKVQHDFRKTWREPFFKVYEDVWATVNARNMRFPFQEGLIQREIYAFNEKAFREALLNAVAHRDYNMSDRSILIAVDPEKLVVKSPGGFPAGITPENILHEQAWRNRVIAETFEKAGLVERSGQGMDDIFGSTIRDGKGVPDFAGSDNYAVRLNIPIQLKDKGFVMFLEKVTDKKQIHLSFEEMYELECIREQRAGTLSFKDKFLSLGIIEQVGRTKGAKYILAHAYYKHAGRPGVHTRLAGLSRDQKKELILTHLRRNKKGYVKDIEDGLSLKRKDVTNLLAELKRVGKIEFIGARKTGYWQIKL